jgi:hypothetical protein
LAQKAHGIKIRFGRQIMALRGASRHTPLAACQPLFTNIFNIGAACRSLERSGDFLIEVG